MDFKNKDLDWLIANLDNLPEFEHELCARFYNEYDFFVRKEFIPTVTDIAEIFKYEVLPVKVDEQAIIGDSRIIHDTEDGIAYYENHYLWQDQIKANPDKKYLVLFDVDDAEPRLVNSLKSFIENHVSDNMIIAVTSSDEEKVRKSTIHHVILM